MQNTFQVEFIKSAKPYLGQTMDQLIEKHEWLWL